MLFQLVALPMKGVASALLERSFSRPLLHLGFRLLRYQNYRARRLNVDLRFLFDVRVREIEEEFRSHGFDDLHDELIHLFFLKFVAPEYLLPEVAGEFEEQTDLSEMLIDDLAKRYVDLKDDVDALEKKYKEDEVLNFVRGTRYAAMFFVNTMYLDTKSGKYYESLAKLHGGFTSRPDLPQIEKLKRKAARLARISAEAIRDREAYQIQIDHNDVVVFLAVATPVFFISGYVYNLIFLGYFGIDVSLYFGLSDYISSSVDQIRFSIVGAIASIVGLLSARIEASRKSYSQIRNEREKREHSVIKNKG